MSWLALAVLALGSLALRSLGPVLAGGRPLSPRVRAVTELLPPALLAALVAVQALEGDGGILLDARVPALAAAAIAVWFRAPFIVVVLVGVGVAAGLRALGVG